MDKIYNYPMGMTVRELKELVKNLPETDIDGIEELEVWIDNGDGTSRPVFEVWPLNKISPTKADLLFS